MEEKATIDMEYKRLDIVPTIVPMSHPYASSVYFVRECYATYYEQIQELLGSQGMKYISVTGTPGMNYISVTGTPGIGKSMFYLYVFNRFRREYPEMTIVTATFSKDREVEKCVVFRRKGYKICENKGVPYVPINQTNCIHLYDGPPKVKPSDSQMIAFTSPNASWLGSMRKVCTHCTLFMPLWTFEELSDANELLNLKITLESLKEYYGKFGGVARYCIARSSYTVREGLEGQETALGRIKSFDDVQACLIGKRDLEEVVHRLFYYEPLLDEVCNQYFMRSRLQFGSKWMAARIEERINSIKKIERVDLMRWLDGVPKGASLYGWLFEQYAHEIFQEGGQFELHSLLGTNEQTTLNVDPKIGHYERFGTSESLEQVFQDIYMIPRANTYEALDSFYYSKEDNVIYAFQITRSVVHPVKAYGLEKLLEIAGLVDETLKGDIQLVLVFVIPKGLGDKFNKQNIVFEDIPRIEDLEEYPIRQVKGVGGAKRYKRLRDDVGIKNGRELYDAARRNDPEISFVGSVATEFANKVESRSSWDFLADIAQYYIEFAVEHE